MRRTRLIYQAAVGMSSCVVVGVCAKCDSPIDSTMHSPRTLDCGHVFCTACVSAIVKAAKSDAQGWKWIDCPTDHTATRVGPNDSVDALPQHATLMKLLMQADKSHGSSKDASTSNNSGGGACCDCEFHPEVHAATHFCRDCPQKMCDTAFAMHAKVRVFREHTVVAIDEAGGGDGGAIVNEATAVCEEHKQPMIAYDVACERMVCGLCLVKNHAGHHCKTGEEVRDEMVQEMSAMIAEVKGMVVVYHQKQNVVEGVKQKIAQMGKDAIADIADYFDQVWTHKQAFTRARDSGFLSHFSIFLFRFV
jgi:hypothetical protein